MSRWAQLRDEVGLVAGRELRVRSRTRLFRGSIVVQAAIVAGILVIAGATSGRGGPPTYVLAVAGAPDAAAATVHAAPAFGVRVSLRELGDAAAVERALRTRTAAAGLAGDELLTRSGTPPTLVAVAQAGQRQRAAARALADAHVAPGVGRTVLAPPALAVRGVAEARRIAGGDRALASISAILLYMALISSGIAVASGVVEEKASRVVELVLSAVEPRALLAGKVLGIGLLSLAQIAIVAGVALIVGLGDGQVTLPHATGATIALVLVFFLLGYALYASVYATVGALVSRQEDLQSAQMPVLLALVAGYALASGVAASDPGGAVAVIGTLVPFTAPFVVPVRAALGGLPAWQLALSCGLTLASVLVCIRLAAGVYAYAILHTGAPLRWRAVLRREREAPPRTEV